MINSAIRGRDIRIYVGMTDDNAYLRRYQNVCNSGDIRNDVGIEVISFAGSVRYIRIYAGIRGRKSTKRVPQNI